MPPGSLGPRLPKGQFTKRIFTAEQYEAMRAAWAENPSIMHIVRKFDLGKEVARRVIMRGLPELDLPPFPMLAKEGAGRPIHGKDPAISPPVRAVMEQAVTAAAVKRADRDVAQARKTLKRIEREERALRDRLARAAETGDSAALSDLRAAYGRYRETAMTLREVGAKSIVADNVRRSGEEAAAARISLRSAVQIAALVGHMSERLIEGLETGTVQIPLDLDSATIGRLASAADAATGAVERALRLERVRQGEPERIIGVQIGALLDKCSDDELDYVKRTGRLPSRVVAVVQNEPGDGNVLPDRVEGEPDGEEGDGDGPDGQPDQEVDVPADSDEHDQQEGDEPVGPEPASPAPQDDDGAGLDHQSAA